LEMRASFNPLSVRNAPALPPLTSKPTSVDPARISNNLGDAKSLVTHPATTTHQRLSPEARAELGISDGFIRFSAGLEHADDLIEDLQVALEKA
jgi:O-acetylhomoserine/O-acetylserine sulfhydrylase-like pyridoxal-dependent enzyme